MLQRFGIDHVFSYIMSSFFDFFLSCEHACYAMHDQVVFRARLGPARSTALFPPLSGKDKASQAMERCIFQISIIGQKNLELAFGKRVCLPTSSTEEGGSACMGVFP